MNINLFVGQKNEVVIISECQFNKPLSAIFFDEKTRLVYLLTKNTNEIIELDCPVDNVLAEKLLTQSICAFGFLEEDKMIEACFLPVIHSKSEFKGGVHL